MPNKTRCLLKNIQRIVLGLVVSLPGLLNAQTSDEDLRRWEEEQAKMLNAAQPAPDVDEDKAPKDAPTDAGSVKSFETLLKKSFHGTYSFYLKLSDSDRAAAYQIYRETGSIVKARILIVNRYMGR